jgi:hypothetical protein
VLTPGRRQSYCRARLTRAANSFVEARVALASFRYCARRTRNKLAEKNQGTAFALTNPRNSHASLRIKEGVSPKIASERPAHTDAGVILNTYTRLRGGPGRGSRLQGRLPQMPR